MIFDQKNLRDSRNPERDNERRLAGQVLLQAIRDYHCAKYLIQKERVAKRYEEDKDLSFLSREQLELLYAGKDAWEWLNNPPLQPVTGWTLERCCEVLDLDVEFVRDMSVKPSSIRALKNANHGAYHTQKGITEGHRQKRKLKPDQVRAIRTLKGKISLENIGKQFGVSDHTVRKILSGERYQEVI